MVRARAKIGLANLAYNFTGLAWLKAQLAPRVTPNSDADARCSARPLIANRRCKNPLGPTPTNPASGFLTG
jgi:hypothetical protein